MALYRDDPYQRLRDLAAGVESPAVEAPKEKLLTPEQVAFEADRAYAANQSEAGKAFTQGLENLRATGYAARGLARIPFNEEAGVQDLVRSQEISDRAAQFGPEIQQFDQVEGVGDFGQWLTNNTLTQLPNIAVAAASGGTAAAARVGAGSLARKVAVDAAARSAAAGVAEREVARRGTAAALARTGVTAAEGTTAAGESAVARDALTDTLANRARSRVERLLPERNIAAEVQQGAAAGGAAAGVGLQTSIAPDIVLDQNAEGTVKERAAVAAVGALVTGSLEALPVMRLLGRYGGEEATKAVTGGVISRMAQHAGRQGLSEAGTELAQTAGEKMAHRYVNENVQVLGPEAYSDYLNAAAGGFFGGAVFGAPAGLRGSGKAGPGYEKMRGRVRDIVDRFTPDFGAAGKPAGPDTSPQGGGTGGTGLTFDGPANTTETNKVTEFYNRFFGQQNRESSIDDALDGIFNEIYSTTPYDYTQINGEVEFNRPFNNFADSARARASVAAGVPVDIAVVASTVPANREASLSRSGALRAAADVLRGDALDRVDKAALRSYVSVLTPESRKAFIRTAATMQELAASDNIQRDASGKAENAQIIAPPVEATNDGMSDFDVAENTTEPVGLRDPKTTYTEMMKGLPAGMAAKRRPDSIPVTDRNGKSRFATPAKLGAMVNSIKTDAEFIDATRNMTARERNVAAVVQVAAEVKMGGGNLDLSTLRAGMELGKNWKLLPVDVANINKALATDAVRNTGGTTQGPVDRLTALKRSAKAAQMDKATERERARDAIGTDDLVQEQQGEVNPADEAARLGPRPGVPRTLPEVTVIEEGSTVAANERGTRVPGAGPTFLANNRDGKTAPERAKAAKLAETAADGARVKVSEAPTIDSKDDIDTEAAKVENEQYGSGPFADLDRLIERHTGQKVSGSFARRNELFDDILERGKIVTTSPARSYTVNGEVKTGAQKRRRRQLGPNERTELLEARRAFVEASHTAAEKKVKEATTAWQKARKALAEAPEGQKAALARKLTTAKKVLDKAQQNLETLADEVQDFDTLRKVADDARIEADRKLAKREATKPASQKTLRERVDTLKKDRLASEQAAINAKNQANARQAENSAEAAMREAHTAESIHNEIPKTSSRRELDALANTIVYAKGLSETRRVELLKMVVERRAELTDKINKAAEREHYHRRQEASPAHSESARKALAGKTTLIGALNALRSIGNAKQNRLIDTLVQMGALRGVAFSDRPIRGAVRQGSARGAHYSTAAKKGLDSVVTVNMAEWAHLSDNNTDVVQLVLHEAIHAATSHAELTNPSLRNDLKKILAHAREMAPQFGIDPDQWYGLSETQEFIAEAFTNPDFQRILEAMPAANTTTFRSLWAQFKGFVAKLLGLQGKDASLLDEVFTVGLEMARKTAESRNDAMLAELGLSEPTAEYSPEGPQPANIAVTPVSGGRPTDYVTMLPPAERLRLLRAFTRADVRRAIIAEVPRDQRHILNTADQGSTLFLNTGIALGLANRLPLNRAQTSAVRQLGDAIRNTLQIPSATTYANQILRDLRAGVVNRDYSSRAKLLNPTANAVFEAIDNKITPLVRALASDMDERMRSTGVPALTELATLISQRAGEFRSDQGRSYLASRGRERSKRLNDFYAIIEGWDDKKKAQITRALQAQAKNAFLTDTDKATGKQVFEDMTPDAQKVLGFFKDMATYMEGAGLKFGKTKEYFPVTIDAETIAAKKDEFIALMSEPQFAPFVAAHGGAEGLYRAAVSSTTRGEQSMGGVTFSDGKHDPKLRPLNQRISAFVYKHGTDAQKAQFAEFQDPNLERIAVNYINRAVSRAEWSRLNLGDKIQELRAKAVEQGASPKQMQLASDYIDQAMGVYGQDWHPAVKRVMEGMDKLLGTKLADTDFNKVKGLQGAIMTYQNLRLLPLAMASSLIDPLGSSVRSGGQLRHHFKAMREAARAIRDSGGPSVLRDMARDMGIVERNAVNEALTYMFGGAHDPSGRMAKVNNALFKYNGLELVTKYSRLTALSLGHKFLLQHALAPGKHSNRYLAELGLKPSDVKPDGNGYVVRNDKVDAALWRFVDESVVRPTPVQRPGWHNDPHFALAAQYKGYLYSFWNTVMRRAATELKNGNYSVLVPLMLYLPVTAVGEMMRDGLQDDDDDRDMMDYAALAVDRSGLLGPKINLLASARQDQQYGSSALNSLSGPTAQQMSNIYSTVAGERSASKTAVQALPGSALFEDWTL